MQIFLFCSYMYQVNCNLKVIFFLVPLWLQQSDFDAFAKRTPLDSDLPLQRHKYERKHKRLPDVPASDLDRDFADSPASGYIPPEADAVPVDVSAGECVCALRVGVSAFIDSTLSGCGV